METHKADTGLNHGARPAGPSRALGATLIALSLLRWPATALLLSPAWHFPALSWNLILAVQVAAETAFWVGVWLLGGKSLADTLARVARTRPVRAVVIRGSRLARWTLGFGNAARAGIGQSAGR